jgi:integrase/recombinase XerD
MKNKIILKRVFHRDKWRLLISFSYDDTFGNLIKKVNGATYSNTLKSWYADDNEETLRQVLSIFRDVAEIDIFALTQRTENPEARPAKKVREVPAVEPEQITTEQKEENRKFEPDIIPPSKFFRKKYNPVEFRINEEDGRLSIRFTGYYDAEWIDELKTFGKFTFDSANREFLLPWSVLTVDSLSDYFASRDVEVRVIKPVPTKALKNARRGVGDEIRGRILGAEALEGLDQMRRYLDEVRYSNRTNISYLALLELFFKYFNERNPLSLTMDEVSEFVHDFIITNGYSISYQNQMISAIKTFYRISGKSHTDLQLFERPRRSRALPKVFSKEEVKRILNATRNIKHKLLLWMIYSCGLRRSEVTNIRMTDLDRDRSVMHIREGKGRVDRIVPVSPKVWDKLDEYIDGFSPAKYLFEGQNGGKYSVESVYRVFKQALQKAGIRKEVGVHSLRHSYATHLHESGLDIRYIQELLGHRSTRTTEIYTHVSRRNLVQVRSPIEDIDVK